MRPGVTAVIPSIPPRVGTALPRALASVMAHADMVLTVGMVPA